LLFRFDQYLFRKHVSRFGAGISPICDLCGLRVVECQAHGLGGCPHALSHKLFCARHGKVAHLLELAVKAAVFFCVLAATETHTTFQEPPWLLPGQVRATTPDLLVVQGLQEGVEPRPEDRPKYKIKMFEWFHTTCPNLTNKWAGKTEQHTPFVRQLAGVVDSSAAAGGRPGRRAGRQDSTASAVQDSRSPPPVLSPAWGEVTQEALGVTYSGLITGNFVSSLQQIGVGSRAARSLVVDVARAAVQSSVNIVFARKGARKEGVAPLTSPDDLPPDLLPQVSQTADARGRRRGRQPEQTLTGQPRQRRRLPPPPRLSKRRADTSPVTRPATR